MPPSETAGDSLYTAGHFTTARPERPVKLSARLHTELRAAWRLSRVAIHILRGVIELAWFFPRRTVVERRTAKQRWSMKLLAVLGVSLKAPRHFNAPTPCLIVCNHISWLDIFVINALTETHFVCKEEVRDWPVIGYLVERSETVFIARGSRAAAVRTGLEIRERLSGGDSVAVFPEGTTTNGQSLLPFRGALFQPATDTGKPVLPIALRYLDSQGQSCLAPAYDGDVTMWQSMRAIVCAPSIVASIMAGIPLDGATGRRQCCVQSQQQIAEMLQLPVPTTPVENETLADQSALPSST